MVDEQWQKILIDTERENISFYAQEIGFFKSMTEKTKDLENETLNQWFEYFITYSQIELENANGRLQKYRQELIDYELRN